MEFFVKDVEYMVKYENVEYYECYIEDGVGEIACNGIEGRGNEGEYKAVKPHFMQGGVKERCELSVLVSHIKGIHQI